MGLPSWLLNCFHPTLSTIKSSVQHPCFCCQAVLQTWWFFLSPCAPSEFWCLFLSQTAQQTTALLFHISLLLGRQQIISCSLPKLVLIGLKGDPRVSLPHLLQNKAPDTFRKNSSIMLYVPFPKHQLLHQFYLSLLLCCRVPRGLAGLAPGRCCFRINSHRTMTEGYLSSTLLHWGMPSKSRSRSGRIELLLHLGSTSILAGFTHSSNLCHNKMDI